jgi:lysophospholipase L1-like esterase
MSNSPRFFSVLIACFALGLTLDFSAFESPSLASQTAESKVQPDKLPTLFIVGDSTVKNGIKGMVGWGEVLGKHFDKSKIKVENHAIAGRSSRTFQTEGRWDKILAACKAGDFVLVQMGHNDGGPVDAKPGRGSLPGLGEETREIDNPATKTKEVVHTYGWYMRKFINDSRAKGMTPIICSQIPHLPKQPVQPGAVEKINHVKWAEEVAKNEKADFIDLNRLILAKYVGMAVTDLEAKYFAPDKGHSILAGAELNALCVVEGIRALAACPLSKYLAETDKLTLAAGTGAKSGPIAATQAKLNGPFGVDFNKNNTMYIVDHDGHQVHQVTPRDNLFQTIAGSGTKGDSGDGGSALKAEFNGMHSLAVLPDGHLCVADTYNNRLRKIEILPGGDAGVVNTIAGTGKKGFSGDGGPALQASFGNIYCVCLDPRGEHLYIADLDHRRIRKIVLATGIVSTVAGNGDKGVPADGSQATKSPLVDPRAVAVDKKGNLWILERGGHALRVVDDQGKIRTVAGTGKKGDSGDGGDALTATFNSPKHLCIDLDGNVIIADSGNHAIRKYLVGEGKIVRVAGSGKKGDAGVGGDPLKADLNEPHGVCVHPSGALFIVDSNNHRVLKLEK